MPPEQARGETIDARADVYALAATLYHLLANKLPKPEAYEALSEIDESIPPALDVLLRRSLGPIADRIASAQAFADAFGLAQRVHTSTAEILASGQLHEIVGMLQGMTSAEFLALKLGQRRVLFQRLKHGIASHNPSAMRGAVAFLLELMRLSAVTPADDFRTTISASLLLGFDHQFGVSWRGSPDLREAIERAVLTLPPSHHRVMTNEVLEWAVALDGGSSHVRESWYQIALKRILQLMIVSDHCSDEDAERLVAVQSRLS